MSTPSLAALQQEFGDALHYQPHTLPVSPGITEPEALLQVYRNNFVMTLTECLETAYPVVSALVGDECFQAIARHHVLNTKMDNACADRYGEGFADTVRALPNIIDAVPYLADMAELEWHLQCVNRAPLPAPFPLEALSKVAPEDIAHLHLSRSAGSRVMQSEFAIAALWQAVTDNDEAALAEIDLARPEAVLVQKTQDGIRVATLREEEARLAMASPHTALGDINPAWLPFLSDAVQHGLFDGFTLTSQEHEQE